MKQTSSFDLSAAQIAELLDPKAPLNPGARCRAKNITPCARRRRPERFSNPLPATWPILSRFL